MDKKPPAGVFRQEVLLHCLDRSVDRIGCFLACDAAEDHEIGHSVAAQAVSAVNAAGHFTRGEEAGNGLAFGADHLGGGIDLHAAHGMVDTRCDGCPR